MAEGSRAVGFCDPFKTDTHGPLSDNSIFHSPICCDSALKKSSAPEVAETLMSKYKVGAVPQGELGKPLNGIRLAFCSVKVEQIPALVERLAKAVADCAK